MRVALVLVCLLVPLASTPATEGEQAPVFVLPELNTDSSIELSDYAGKVIYLDFWASWCAPCRVSFPEIIQLKQDLADQPFEVIAVSVDENPADAMRFLRRYDVPYPILQDSSGQWAAKYELPGMPTSFVIDQQGVIRFRHSGFKPGDMDKIREKINTLLAGPES